MKMREKIKVGRKKSKEVAPQSQNIRVRDGQKFRVLCMILQ